jgi:hypothetical protein
LKEGIHMPGLYEKLRKIQDEVANVEKTGYNNFQNYYYHTEADILNALKPLLKKYGLVIIPSLDWDHANILGAPATMVNDISLVYTKYTVVDTEAGEKEIIYWYGQGQDKGDKGANKAFTAAGKYAMIKLFQIASDEDADAEGAPAKAAVPAKQVAVKPVKPAAPAVNPNKPAAPIGPVEKCEECAAECKGGVAAFSKKEFGGHVYCMACQNKHR